MKIALYILTIAIVVAFASWEVKLRRLLTAEFDDFTVKGERVSDYGIVSDISKQFKREHYLRSLPPEKLIKLRVVAGLKILFGVTFFVEVILLQR